jgi:hypothetical protein
VSARIQDGVNAGDDFVLNHLGSLSGVLPARI